MDTRINPSQQKRNHRVGGDDLMFNLEEFIITNLIEGYRSNTFNEYQVNIYASGYMLKGAITQDGFNEILQAIENIKNPPEYEELPE